MAFNVNCALIVVIDGIKNAHTVKTNKCGKETNGLPPKNVVKKYDSAT